ncbi:hypothetical protein Fot_28422 [Forsythia ovata]|uniref:Uncharacterized protein n=1 Tax=Forsythia ovata TaxID=205694 RepID=A0ABD1TP07_9LAMI
MAKKLDGLGLDDPLIQDKDSQNVIEPRISSEVMDEVESSSDHDEENIPDFAIDDVEEGGENLAPPPSPASPEVLMAGSENKALRSKVDTLASVEDTLKVKLDALAEDIRQSDTRALEAQGLKKAVESARRQAEERATAAEETITSVNHEFDAMVLEKDKQLSEALADLAKAKEELVIARSSI